MHKVHILISNLLSESQGSVEFSSTDPWLVFTLPADDPKKPKNILTFLNIQIMPESKHFKFDSKDFEHASSGTEFLQKGFDTCFLCFKQTTLLPASQEDNVG